MLKKVVRFVSSEGWRIWDTSFPLCLTARFADYIWRETEKAGFTSPVTRS
nr:MAG TPA: hypothetical protein [Caudoviricetes sp.]